MQRSLRLNITAGALGMFWLCAPLGAPLPLLLQAVHASSTQLGILSALWQIAMLAQIPAAFVAESLPRRKPLWAVTAILHRILWATPAALPWLFPQSQALWPILLIGALGLSNLLANLGTASWLSWMADLVPPESAGRFWAIRQRALSLCLIVSTALYGVLLDHFALQGSALRGFQWVFALCSLFGIADIVVHCFVEEPLQSIPHTSQPWLTRLQTPFLQTSFTLLTAAMAAWNAAQSLLGYTLGVPGFFSMVHLRETFGASYTQASFLFIAASLGAALFTPWLGPWMDRAGAHQVLLRLTALCPLSMAAWWLAVPGNLSIGSWTCPSAVLWMSFAALFQGALTMGSLLCQFRLCQACLPEGHGRTVAMAVHWSLTGVGGALGALTAGSLKDHLPSSILHSHWLPLPSSPTAFDFLVLLHALLTWGLVLPLCFHLRRHLTSSLFPPPQRSL